MDRVYRLAYREYGDPTLPTIVLLMGLGMPSIAWPESLIQTLIRQGLHVIAPDNRDCGESEHGSEKIAFWSVARSVAWYLAGGSVKAPYTVDDMAADVEGLLNQKGLERVHIAGFSLGGMIAQAFALRAPHRTITLSCISTASGNPKTGLGRWNAVRAVLNNCKQEENAERRYKKLVKLVKTIGSPGANYSDAELMRLMQVLKGANVSEETVRRQLMAILAGGNRCRRLRQLVVPTLIIHGEADPLLPIRAGEELAHCIEGAKLCRIRGMGHDLPETFVEEIGCALAQHCYSGVLR